MYYEAGHVFLAKLGKTTLRPGGIDATAWLIEQARINSGTKILEVACNMGRTMIQLSKKYGCKITGVDLDKDVLKKAEENIRKNHLEDKLTLIHGDALALPFEDASFDIVVNEAMLTMLVGDKKDKALKEYFRVLKPGGLLLTHDVALRTADSAVQKELRSGLSKAINVSVEPLDAGSWKALFLKNGFTVTQKSGDMTLMSPIGIIHDEGFAGALRIMRNAMKKENKAMFRQMFRFFNEHKKELAYICSVGTKQNG
ncbi:class I SAM-dependent methyltransferase [Treponema lecithinolyticum]|uniref:SAM-dependent methyltransferase n=1 Tax=Treponema lecithinolyticum TaxID=53418 RepID=UPI0028EB3338|nr:class I SAM-dependent methyltransferase [Treponema lecithinolyticum]